MRIIEIRREAMEIRRPVARFVDELQWELARRTLVVTAAVETSAVFGDFCWAPMPSPCHPRVLYADPVAVFTAFTRFAAVGRYLDQIRMSAGPLLEGAYPWWWDGSQPARRAAIEAEPEERQIAILESVADAATVVHGYLGGASLRELMAIVPMRRGPWGFVDFSTG